MSWGALAWLYPDVGSMWDVGYASLLYSVRRRVVERTSPRRGKNLYGIRVVGLDLLSDRITIGA